MVPIPAGKLMVYSKYDGKEVFIDNFFMDSFEVSQESYEKIINFNPSFFVH
jgi:formylglycine-generating enzyme required for sulfatase activity